MAAGRRREQSVGEQSLAVVRRHGRDVVVRLYALAAVRVAEMSGGHAAAVELEAVARRDA